MQRIPLGRTGLTIPDLCLGTMTWGTTTPEAEAFVQIETALDHGLDFMDTAHMYPVTPMRPETAGRTEEIIGNWVTKTGRRNDVIIATKHIGSGSSVVAGGSPPISAETIPAAVEGSLRRLQTDVIDLYQLHWPNRGSYMFRQNWTFDPSRQDTGATLQNLADCMGALKDMVDQGKIRSFGLSNESAWGTMKWIQAAEDIGGPRVCAVQNEYSLLCRLYDTDMAEVGVHEDVVLLAFSPLGTGYLTGQYQDGSVPAGSRMTHGSSMGGRATERVGEAVQGYLDVAQKHGLDPVAMSLAFCRSRPFPTSAIFGARTQVQLDRILAGKDLELSDEVLRDIDVAHRAHPMPY